MNTGWAFFFVGVGIGLVAIHNYIRREAERRARKSGYEQGKKEMRLYYQGHYPYIPLPEPVVEEREPEHGVVKEKIVVDESFMEDLRKNGKAATKFPKAK